MPKTEHKLLEKLYNQIILLSVLAVFAFGVIFLLLTLLPQFTELIPFRFIGETLVTSGSIGVIVSLILGRRSEYVMRVKNLGLEEGQTLTQSLNERGFRSAKYFYNQRDYEWEFQGGTDESWAAKVTDTIRACMLRDVESLTFAREATVETSDSLSSVCIFDLTDNEPLDKLKPTLIDELSIPTKKFFRLNFRFLADHEYEIKLGYSYPPSMNKKFDYIHMMNPVKTNRSKITIKLPDDFRYERYNFFCHVMNSRYDNVKKIKIENFDASTRTLAFKEDGPFYEGETIILKYEKINE